MTEPRRRGTLRYTRQISATHWFTECKICPRGLGKRSGKTEQALDDWWATHITSEQHERSVSPEIGPEVRLINEYFGKTPKDRTGRITDATMGRERLAQDSPRSDRGS